MAFKKRYYFRKKKVAMPDEFRHRHQRPRPLSLEELYLMQYLASLHQAGYQIHRNTQRPYVAPEPKQSIPNPYAVLRVSKTASKEEISEAYRKMAKQYHPDTVAHLGPEIQNEAERKMKVINEAYDTFKKMM